MLGSTVEARTRLAAELADCRAVLDAGCGIGSLAGAMRAAGIPEVWGIEPSAYLLQLAAARHRGVRFAQGIVESTGFPSARFDGVGACFLFHELPPRAADASLDEIRRILVPGGRLVIAEPSPVQFRVRDWRALVRRSGRRGLYFFLLASWMHEPFVDGWHRRDVGAWLAEHGFRLVADEVGNADSVRARFATTGHRISLGGSALAGRLQTPARPVLRRPGGSTPVRSVRAVRTACRRFG